MEKVFKSWWFTMAIVLAIIALLWWVIAKVGCPKKRVQIDVLSIEEGLNPKDVIKAVLKLHKLEDDIKIVNLGSLLDATLTLEVQSSSAYKTLKKGLDEKNIKYTSQCAKA